MNIRKMIGWSEGLGVALALSCATALAQSGTPAASPSRPSSPGTTQQMNAPVRWGTPAAPAQQRAVIRPTSTARPAQYQSTSASSSYEPTYGSFYDEWIKGRLALGLSLGGYWLTEDKRPPSRATESTFVGNVNKLDASETVVLLPYVSYKFCPYARAVLTMQRLKAETRNYNKKDDQGDGWVSAQGPVLRLEGMYPFLEGRLTPHVGVGAFFAFGDFKEYTWWNLGYGTKADWDYLGKPDKCREDHYREIHVDDDIGLELSAGLSYQPLEHLLLDCSFVQTSVDLDCQYGYRYKGNKWEEHRTGDFELDNMAVLLTATYVF